MKKVMIIALILVGALFIPTVSAEKVLYDEEINDYEFTGFSYTVIDGGGVPSSDKNEAIGIYFKQISNATDVSYIVIDFYKTEGIFVDQKLEEGRSSLSYSFDSNPGVSNEVIVYTDYNKDIFGEITSIRYTLFFQNWDVNELTGSQTLKFDSPLLTCRRFSGVVVEGMEQMKIVGSNGNLPFHKFTVSCGKYTRNHITISETDNDYIIQLQRVLDKQYFSTLSTKLNDTVYYTHSGNTNLDLYFLKSEIDSVELVTGLKTHLYPLSPGFESTNDTVTIYVRNSQTGALLANANLVISANVSGNFQEVVNETVPSGIYSIDLQPTGGGMPNPDYYRLWVTIDGYNSQMPYMDFDVSGGTSVYVYMEPTGEPPVDENMTFVEFYVRDIYANPLANADVSCGGYTLKTNSAGYTQFELPKNAVYSYSVSKTGYMTIEGIATVENDGRYTVNVALMAGVVPTQTVVTPTITVEPTPTQTTPPIQEDNIIGLSVNGLAKGFGIDYDTALLLFGLMIIFGAGGIVMSSVNGGAMEFIAGSIVGTFVAFALGLIPIWIFIIIAVVFGAYVLRVFIQGGQ